MLSIRKTRIFGFGRGDRRGCERVLWTIERAKRSAAVDDCATLQVSAEAGTARVKEPLNIVDF